MNPCKSDTPHLWIIKNQLRDKRSERVLVFIYIYRIDVNIERLKSC